MLVQVGQRYVSEQREIDPFFVNGMKELLSKSKVFNGFHEGFIRDLIVSCSRKEYNWNRFLMEEGTRGDSMYVLYKGAVEVTSNGKYVCKLRDGSIIGEAALLNADNRRTASVRSVQKCDVAIILRSSFHSILEKYPWEKRRIQRSLKVKLSELGKLVHMKDDINFEQQAAQYDALKKVPLFSNEETMHDFMSELAMNASSHWYRTGRVIIQEGDTRCDEMFVLLSGAVEVFACGEFLGRLENDIFGEICVLDLLERRTANVIAATHCHCMVFTRQVFIPVLAKHPDARVHLLEHARKRLVALNAAIGMDCEAAGGAASVQLPGCALGFGSTVKQADAQLFSASPIFSQASAPFLCELSSKMMSKKFDEGRTIIEEGTIYMPKTDYVYWIQQGQVEVWRGDYIVTVLGVGAVFGELAAYKSGKRHATVKSKTKVLLRMVRGAALQEVMEQFPDDNFVDKWEGEMQRRLQQLTQKDELLKASANKPAHIDFMFMKLPKLNAEGRRLPMSESVGPALSKTCALTGLGVVGSPKPAQAIEMAKG
mmetsp:Transcript_13507/g.36440  ORF Transcript_13507/g.36440 Transcript_13507/m.36440 type:complete len:541 (-) Transcript_13507:90-1712(-)